MIKATIEEFWVMRNPNAFEITPSNQGGFNAKDSAVYAFVLKTDKGWVETKGILSRRLLANLESWREEHFPVMSVEDETWFAPEKPSMFNKFNYPHLEFTKVDDLDVYIKEVAKRFMAEELSR